jgi:hypothetical protein
MTYSVTWTGAAIQLLAALERAAADPSAVRKAGDWVDYTLRRIPSNVGESRSGNDRLWYGDVLGVYYRVDDTAMTVRIISVGPARRR